MNPETLEALLEATFPNVDRMIGVMAAAMTYGGLLTTDHDARHARATLETFQVTNGTNRAEQIGHPVSAHHIWQEAAHIHLARLRELNF